LNSNEVEKNDDNYISFSSDKVFQEFYEGTIDNFHRINLGDNFSFGDNYIQTNATFDDLNKLKYLNEIIVMLRAKPELIKQYSIDAILNNYIPLNNKCIQDFIKLISYVIDYSKRFRFEKIIKEIIEYVQSFPVDILHLFSKFAKNMNNCSDIFASFLLIYNSLHDFSLLLDYQRILFYLLQTKKIKISNLIIEIIQKFFGMSNIEIINNAYLIVVRCEIWFSIDINVIISHLKNELICESVLAYLFNSKENLILNDEIVSIIVSLSNTYQSAKFVLMVISLKQEALPFIIKYDDWTLDYDLFLRIMGKIFFDRIIFEKSLGENNNFFSKLLTLFMLFL
jgi:hypothetical protein